MKPRIRRDWPKPKVQREKVEQAHGVQLLRSLGAAVYVSGTHRKRDDFQGTMQTPGIPDVEAFLPRRHMAAMGGEEFPTGVVTGWQLLKWEVKAVGGKLSLEQRDYQRLCGMAHVAHVVGTFDDLIAWLITDGYLKPQNVPHYRTPRPADLTS